MADQHLAKQIVGLQETVLLLLLKRKGFVADIYQVRQALNGRRSREALEWLYERADLTRPITTSSPEVPEAEPSTSEPVAPTPIDQPTSPETELAITPRNPPPEVAEPSTSEPVAPTPIDQPTSPETELAITPHIPPQERQRSRIADGLRVVVRFLFGWLTHYRRR